MPKQRTVWKHEAVRFEEELSNSLCSVQLAAFIEQCRSCVCLVSFETHRISSIGVYKFILNMTLPVFRNQPFMFKCTVGSDFVRSSSLCFKLFTPIIIINHHYHHNQTPQSRVLFQELVVTYLVQKFHACYLTRMFITVFTTACHWSLS